MSDSYTSGSYQIDLTERQWERFEGIRAECKKADPGLPPPSDELLFSSLLDTWDAVGEGHYSDGPKNPMPAGRLAAELGHYSSVRLAYVQFPYRLYLNLTDDGLSRGPLKTIREFGWMVSGFSSNSASVVRNDRSRDTGNDQEGDY